MGLISIDQLYHQLSTIYQADNWWSEPNPYKVIVGSILTQNTSWQNVLKSLDSLSKSTSFEPNLLLKLDKDRLVKEINPSGFANQKSQYLINVTFWYLNIYPKLDRIEVRDSLLKVVGVGPETCDSIMLYALNIPTFVIDSYTQRIMYRLGYNQTTYHDLQTLFVQNIKKDLYVYQAYHALLVEHAKQVCLKKPNCAACRLQKYCERRGV